MISHHGVALTPPNEKAVGSILQRARKATWELLKWPRMVVFLSMWSYNEIVTFPEFNPNTTGSRSKGEVIREKRLDGWLIGWMDGCVVL